jgi:hypothetical protein
MGIVLFKNESTCNSIFYTTCSNWFGAYTLNINNVAKTAADYQISSEVSVNQDPALIVS